ncbi:MAG TPA: ABC transporter ATP-binding protein [Pyrinomonadaceae bacterium]|nr:ABC transporter ATP-binding protein [Pyrinomonadaceae bacterium]
MLEIEALRKTYPNGVRALAGVSVEIPAGVFGLLGPNGAGKTTLMKILATLLDPDEGHARVCGVNILAQKRDARRILGYLPQEFGLYPTLTALLTLDYFARLKGVADRGERARLVAALLERVNLGDAAHQRVGGFSGGMRQRLGVAQALIGRPRLIIVDEPTAGLDPEERARFHNLLADVASDDAVVILSTHIVSDVATLCERMAVIRRGEIVFSSTPRDALARVEGAVWEADAARERVAEMKSRLRVVSAQARGGRVRVRVFARGPAPGEEFRAVEPTLEDFYFSLVSEGHA